MKVYVKNKIWSLGGSSSVVDEAQNPVFQVKGKVFSLTRKKTVCDMDGNVLYTLRNKLFQLFTHKVVIKNSEKEKVCTVRNKYFSFKPVYIIKGTEDEYGIEGGFLSLTCNITKNGQVIGTIRRQVTLIADAFELEASQEDLPFCLALVIAVDNITDSMRRQRN